MPAKLRAPTPPYAAAATAAAGNTGGPPASTGLAGPRSSTPLAHPRALACCWCGVWALRPLTCASTPSQGRVLALLLLLLLLNLAQELLFDAAPSTGVVDGVARAEPGSLRRQASSGSRVGRGWARGMLASSPPPSPGLGGAPIRHVTVWTAVHIPPPPLTSPHHHHHSHPYHHHHSHSDHHHHSPPPHHHQLISRISRSSGGLAAGISSQQQGHHHDHNHDHQFITTGIITATSINSSASSPIPDPTDIINKARHLLSAPPTLLLLPLLLLLLLPIKAEETTDRDRSGRELVLPVVWEAEAQPAAPDCMHLTKLPVQQLKEKGQHTHLEFLLLTGHAEAGETVEAC